MKSVVALLVVGLVGSSLAAPSGLLGVGVGIGHGVPLATSALVVGPSGVISSHQTNGAVGVVAPAVVAASPAIIGVGHGLGLGLGGHGLGLGLGLGHGIHGW